MEQISNNEMVLKFGVEKFDDIYGFPAHTTLPQENAQYEHTHKMLHTTPNIPKVMASCTERYQSRADLSLPRS